MSGTTSTTTSGPVFALTPGMLDADTPLDMSTKAAREFYKIAIQPLRIPFDGDSKNINMFQSQLERRIVVCGWHTGGGNIINIPDSKRINQNLIKQYGCLSTNDLDTFAVAYVNNQTRAAQNNHMMAECLMASITDTCFYKISNEEEQYTSSGCKIASKLYKLILSKSVVDTTATTYQLRESLSALEDYMSHVNSNIELFNLRVKNDVEGLRARGETVDDLIMKLFKGYKAAADSKFVAYIETKEESYLDDGLLDSTKLMRLALNKYTMRKTSGKWGAPTEEQEQLIALTSEVSKLQAENKEMLAKSKTNQASGSSSRSAKAKIRAKEERWAWKKVPPSENESNTKVKDDKTYWWCVHHQAWCMHTTQECKNKPIRETPTAKTATLDELVEAAITTIDCQDSDSE